MTKRPSALRSTSGRATRRTIRCANSVVTLVMVAGAALAPTAAHAATAKGLYESALARERSVRARMADLRSPEPARPATPDATKQAAPLLEQIRAVENAYLGVVRHFPASGYCDDALWNAGKLALDAFAQFGYASDRDTGTRLLRLLAAHYPTSKLARRVPDELATVPQATAAAEAKPAAPDLPARGSPAEPRSGVPASAPAGIASHPAAHASLSGTSSHATIRRVTRTVLPDVVRVTIDLDAEMPYHEERLDNPPRVFIDFPSTRAAPGLVDKTIRFEGDTDLVHQIRIGRHPNATTRVVLDAAGVTGYSVYALYNPYRLVIDCARPSPAARTAAGALAVPRPTMPSALNSASISALRAISTKTQPSPLREPELLDGIRLATNWGRRLPAVTPLATAALQAARVETAIADAAVPTAAMPLASPTLIAPPARNSAGGFSMARQLGLGVSRIVIDPGHGGHDPGAQGKGVTEAELVLDIALRLEQLLETQPGVDVVLTRRADEYVPLQERTAIANREGADLFLSIHANASESSQARGVETYFLNFANNLSAAAVAARENAASGQAMGALPDLVKAIALSNKLDESRDFATDVQHAMIQKLRGPNRMLKDLGVKQAPFVVLIGAAMPSVLAEISFVTNPQEAKLLRGDAYRQKIAEALCTAIRRYQASLHAVNKVAAQ